MAGDTFQKFKDSVNRGITTISVKTSSSLEKSKIKTHIDSIEKEVQKILLTVGEEVYGVWSNHGTDYQEITNKLDMVKQKKEEIQQLTAELSSIDERDDQILGKNQEVVPSPEQPVTNRLICPNCGSQYDPPAKFCRKCGYNLQNI